MGSQRAFGSKKPVLASLIWDVTLVPCSAAAVPSAVPREKSGTKMRQYGRRRASRVDEAPKKKRLGKQGVEKSPFL